MTVLTRSEAEMKYELMRLNSAALSGRYGPAIKGALLQNGAKQGEFLVINWLPEQDSEIFTIVLRGDKIMVIEVDRVMRFQNEMLGIKDFMKRGSKFDRRKIGIAKKILESC
jgi:hypothetical protein